jgi:hypothetical protein
MKTKNEDSSPQKRIFYSGFWLLLSLMHKTADAVAELQITKQGEAF